MKFPSNEEWQSWGIANEAHKFFFLRWEELFKDDTYDGWQVKYSNIRTLLKEVLEAAEVVKVVHVYHHNIRSLIDEIQYEIKSNDLVREYYPFLSKYVENLSNDYDTLVKVDGKTNLDKFQKNVRITVGMTDGHIERVKKELAELVFNPSGKYKIKLDNLISELAVELKSIGYSSQALKEGINFLKEVDEQNFNNRLKKLLAQFSGQEKCFQCKFIVTWPGGVPGFRLGDDIVFETGVQAESILRAAENAIRELQSEHAEQVEQATQIRAFYSQDPQQPIVASISVSALDPFAARYNAKERLEKIFALKTIYHPNKNPSIKQKQALITSSDTQRSICVGPDESWGSYVKDANDLEKFMEKFNKIEKVLPIHDTRKILNSLQYHKIAMLSPSDEGKFVNLWIALETLLQEGGSNIIERIIRYIPASNSTTYINRLMKYICIQLSKRWNQTDKSEIIAELPNSAKKYISPEDLLKIFLDEPKGKICTFLTGMVSDNPHALYRLERIWINFDSPYKLKERIESHKTKIEWQLKRIYRARNKIMHQGVGVSGLRQLIQHLHSYYHLAYNSLLVDLYYHDEWTVADAFEYRVVMYNHFLSRLENYDKSNLSLSMLFHPHKAFSVICPAPAWPAKRYSVKTPEKASESK